MGKGLLAAVALSVVLAAVAFVVAVGNPISWTSDQITQSKDCTEVANNPDRLGSLNANGRLCWWKEAWRVFEKHDPGGAGADSFEVARKRFRVDARTVTEPHSVPLQQLAEGGLGGFLLFLALAGSTAWACACTVGRLEGGERAAAVALVAAPAAYGLHALVDYNWDYLATTAPTMVAVGVCALPPAGRSARRADAWRSGSAPSSSQPCSCRSRSRVWQSGTPARPRSHSTRATTRRRRGWRSARGSSIRSPSIRSTRSRTSRSGRATRRRRSAASSRPSSPPENPETWYTLGIYEFQVRENMCAAYRFLNNAYTLDPAGNQWVKGGPLDVSRDAVNHGACTS